MNLYEIIEDQEDEQHSLILRFNLEEFRSSSFWDTSNVDYLLMSSIFKNIKEFQAQYYPDELIIHSVICDNSLTGFNKEFMDKIASILDEVNKMSDSIFSELFQTIFQLDVNNFTLLDKHFSHAILKNTLPENTSNDKKKPKI